MTQKNQPRRWGRLTVAKKVASIPLFFIIAIAVLTTYTIVTVEGQKSDAAVTDLMARQRMLNQQFVKQVVLESQNLRDADVAETRKLFRESLESLIDGGPVVVTPGQDDVMEVPPAPTAAIRANLRRQQRLVEELGHKADEFLKRKQGDAAYVDRLSELLADSKELNAVISHGVTLFAEHARSKASAMIAWEVCIGIACGAAGIVLSWLISHRISNPLGEVVELAQRVADGDLRSAGLSARSSDEVGELTETFTTMLHRLKDLTEQIRSVTENVNTAATQISSSARQQSASTKQQASTIQQITSTMKEIAETGAQIIDKAQELAAKSEATSQTSDSGLESVRATNKTMDSIREQVEEVAENIVALSEKTQAIAEIVATVNEVAEQSNLLALNATIEAADAGEHGSRFSVVAGEMKNLADQAKQCTDQVRSILGDIQKGINGSVMLTEEAVKRVESGRQQAAVSEQAILEMARSMQDSVQAFQQIIGATNQQQVGFDQVTQGMQDIDQAATQTASGTSQLEQAVTDLGSMSRQLKTAVGRYRV